MTRLSRFAAVSASLLLLSTPALAQAITGAGSGSNGGMIDGTTSETSGMMETGKQNLPNATPQPGATRGDTPVLNAPDENKPGTDQTQLRKYP